MAYQRPFEGALNKAIPDAHRKVDEPTNTGKDQKAENTGIRVERYTITPGYFGLYAHASISPVLPPRSTMFEWHKERRRVPATVDKVLIEEFQKMHKNHSNPDGLAAVELPMRRIRKEEEAIRDGMAGWEFQAPSFANLELRPKKHEMGDKQFSEDLPSTYSESSVEHEDGYSSSESASSEEDASGC
ncbi:hypothetical protein BCON_0308g00060 [Botryotinia convoluta]|uniref:Uncharacterized protein n=1 Tax=Botryotinia convoluta TaxID=54673 RepID=A0A4Z1HCE5_9HELO|nr:hypothetical protein BCON_0308g00060 [Botryotinia convoluta]